MPRQYVDKASDDAQEKEQTGADQAEVRFMKAIESFFVAVISSPVYRGYDLQSAPEAKGHS